MLRISANLASTFARIELEAQREQLAGKLATFAHAHPPVPRVHPNAAEIYRQKVADLERALDDPEDKDRASAAIRSLIERIVLYPGDKRGEIRAELYGELAAILQLGEEHKNKKTRTSEGVRVSLVAGTRNHLCRTRIIAERHV